MFSARLNPRRLRAARSALCAALSAGALAVAGIACAQSVATAAVAAPVIYPAKGQSAAQIDRDKYECFAWSKGQTGFDPMQPSPAAPAQAPAPTAQAGSNGSSANSAAGMVKGAAGGAAVAELTNGDAGKGAAVGVLGAAMRERMKQQQTAQARQQQAAQQQQAQQQQLAQQQAARAQQRNTFDRAFGACMEARHYVVK